MNTKKHSLAELFARARKHIAYKVEGVIIEFTEELCKLMQIQGVNKSELAKRLDCKPAFITKLLSGQNNFTIETMVKTADALGAEVRIHLQPAGVSSHWVDDETVKTTNTVIVAATGSISPVDFKRIRVTPSSAAERPLAIQEQAANEELAIAA